MDKHSFVSNICTKQGLDCKFIPGLQLLLLREESQGPGVPVALLVMAQAKSIITAGSIQFSPQHPKNIPSLSRNMTLVSNYIIPMSNREVLRG